MEAVYLLLAACIVGLLIVFLSGSSFLPYSSTKFPLELISWWWWLKDKLGFSPSPTRDKYKPIPGKFIFSPPLTRDEFKKKLRAAIREKQRARQRQNQKRGMRQASNKGAQLVSSLFFDKKYCFRIFPRRKAAEQPPIIISRWRKSKISTLLDISVKYVLGIISYYFTATSRRLDLLLGNTMCYFAEKLMQGSNTLDFFLSVVDSPPQKCPFIGCCKEIDDLPCIESPVDDCLVDDCCLPGKVESPTADCPLDCCKAVTAAGAGVDSFICSPCIPQDKSFTVFASGIGERVVPIQVVTTDSVKDLRKKLAECYETNDFSLRYGSKVLSERNTLRYYNIQKEATLFCSLPLRGGMDHSTCSGSGGGVSDEFAFFNQGSEPESNRKRKRGKNKKRSGAGSKVLPEQQPAKMRREVSEEMARPVLNDRSDDEIQKIIMKHTNDCCRDHKTTFVEKGCFMDIFRLVRNSTIIFTYDLFANDRQNFTTQGPGRFDTTAACNFFRETERPLRQLTLESERKDLLSKLFSKHSVFSVQSKKWEHEYFLFYKEKQYPCCERVFVDLHGFSKASFEKEALKRKGDYLHHNTSKTGTKVYTDSTLHPYSAVEMMDIFSENVVGAPESLVPEFALRAMTPLADRQSTCTKWLDEYFKTYSDHSPNSLFSKVSLTFKLDLFKLYVSQVKPITEVVCYTRFLQLWNILFPYCVNRPWCNVPGKCETCFMIQEARSKLGLDANTSKMLQQCHAIHRGGMFMLERAKYKERVLYACANKTTCMSIIIDGMDQSHCQVPYFGQTHTFAEPLTQHITGVKEHGIGVTIYRTLGTVNKGANLTIYCILSQIESWRNRNSGKYPEELFLQVDGGSENANQYLLGMLELLVYKRLIKKIHFTRLPTGHTHEDIDAIFAVIWKALRKNAVMTLDAYVDMIQKVFSGFEQVIVETPMLIPEYDKWILPAIDNKLGRLHKEILTQHCWRFEAVEKDTFFPTGCKTTYRAYSSDVVVEIRKVSKATAQTPIGRHTGLEAHKVLGPNSIPSRQGVEGFYLLRHINELSWKEPDAEPLHDGSMASLRKTVQAVRGDLSAFPTGSEYRKAWDKWSHIYVLPQTVSEDTNQNETVAYKAQLAKRGVCYKSPLKFILFDEKSTYTAKPWMLGSGSKVISPEFEYPYVLQSAMNSVRTELNPSPLEPRFTALTDEALLADIDVFEQQSRPFYDAFVATRGVTVEAIKTLIRRLFSYDACGYGVSGSKQVLAGHVRSWGASFVCIFYRKLRDGVKIRLDRILTEPILTIENGNRLVTEISNNDTTVCITQSDARSFRSESTLTANALKGILELFRVRDRRVCEAHRDVHHGERYYTALSNSLFFPPSFVAELLDGSLQEGWTSRYDCTNFSSCHRAYCVIETSGFFSLIVLDLKNKTVSLVDPQLDPSQEVPASSKDLLAAILTRLIGVQADFTVDFSGWSPLHKAPHVYCEPLHPEDRVDSVFYMLSLLYFLVVDVPIYFTRDQVKSTVRDNFAFWLLIGGELPV